MFGTKKYISYLNGYKKITLSNNVTDKKKVERVNYSVYLNFEQS